MKREFPKAYQPQAAEEKWYESWQKSGIYTANSQSDKKPYSILMPPPNVTGILHFGHVLNITLQDLYIRMKRMQGYEVCWFPGTDHAGIATQSKVEAELRKSNISRYDLGRDQFIEKVWEWKEKYGGIILKQMRKLGVSADWSRTLFTMDESASNAVKEVFVRLFDEGLIYKGKRIINWSPLAQTALSDEEVEFREVKEHLFTMRYYFEDGSDYLQVATVRPETIFGDTAVAVNPNDERYKHLIGTNVRVPLCDRLIPIVGDDYADPAFGTGCVKITPAHDPNDFLVGGRHNLEMINTINPDGTLNELTGKFNAMERFAARKAILEELKEKELIEKIEDYTHNVGFSQRGGEPVEPYLSDQWFVKMAPLAQDALKVVQSGEVKFYPAHWSKTYEHWMTNIRDWCISRQLWWGHRIPVYYSENGQFTAARNIEEACQKLGLPAGSLLTQDSDVLDTWFSSWLWPMTTMHWMNDNKTESTPDLEKFLPSDLLVTAPDIIFFWVARMIMASTKFKQVIPFKSVYFTSTIRDGGGRKLSKSLGNSPDPLNIIEKYGADAVRFTMIYLSPLGQDLKIDVDVQAQDIQSIEIGRNFANKIWNAGRFLLMKQDEAAEAGVTDTSAFVPGYAEKWIMSRFNTTIKKCIEATDLYKVNEYSKILYDFVWRDFCDWYVEIMKIQMNASNDNNYKAGLLAFAVNLYENILKLIHPVMPYITEEIYHLIDDRDESDTISLTAFPESDNAQINEEIEKGFELAQSLVEESRRMRASLNIPPSQKLPVSISCPDQETESLLLGMKDILTSMARAGELNIGINSTKPEGATASVVREISLYIVTVDSIDVEKEQLRLQKEITRLESNIRGSQGKLSNSKFVDNAPADIVAYENEKLASMIESLTKVKENLASLS